MKKILVTTDLSARSDRAIDRAVKIAKEENAKLTILHIVDEEIATANISENKKIATDEIKNVLKGKKIDDIEIRIEVGEPHREILKISSQNDFDLIIMGMHRHYDSAEPMIGRVIERMIKNSLKPILIVKNRFESDYQNILLAVDFNINSARSMVAAFKTFKKAKFKIFHSFNLPILVSSKKLEDEAKNNCLNDVKDMVKNAIDEIKNSEEIEKNLEIKIVKGVVFETLNKEIKNDKPNVLVIGTRGKTGFSKALSINVAENFLINPPTDLFIVS
jgi:nucleotide-binding universal stress UspA family protein